MLKSLFLILFPSFSSQILSPFLSSVVFLYSFWGAWIFLFISLTCFVVCTCVSLRKLFISCLKASIICMRLDLRPESKSPDVLRYTGLAVVGELCCNVDYVLVLSFCHLVVSGVNWTNCHGLEQPSWKQVKCCVQG